MIPEMQKEQGKQNESKFVCFTLLMSLGNTFFIYLYYRSGNTVSSSKICVIQAADFNFFKNSEDKLRVFTLFIKVKLRRM